MSRLKASYEEAVKTVTMTALFSSVRQNAVRTSPDFY